MQQTSVVTPFWNKIPFFFLYGLRPVPLALSLSLAFIAAVLGLSVIGLFAHLVIYFMMTKYCFAVLEETVEGRLSPPGLTGDVLVEGYEQPAKLYFLLIFFVAAVSGLTAHAGWLAGLAVLLFGLLVMPASIMVLAVSHSAIEALNPVTLVDMIRRIGWPYLALYGFLFMLSTAESQVQALVLPGTPLRLILPVYDLINFYFSIVMFCMMGYVLLQFHEELGEATPAALRVQPDPSDLKLAHFGNLMEEGQTEAAKAELQGLIREDPGDLDIRRRYHNLLRTAGTPEELRRHAQRYIPLLMERGETRAAAEVLMDLPLAGADVQLEHAAFHLDLMRQLRSLGRPKQAVKLAAGFHKRFPGSSEIPPVYVLAARLLCEDLDQDALAEKMLTYVVRTFPGHPDTPEAESLLGTVRKLRSA